MAYIKTIKSGSLETKIYTNRKSMGDAAAKYAAEKLRELLSEKETVNVIFAAAPSQNETLAALCLEEGIDWSRVHAFHMDEYIGLPLSAPQRFGNFLREAIFERLPFGEVNYIDSSDENGDVKYAELLRKNPPDMVCLGIGENGHIAFNDPHVADFSDPLLVKKVELDEKCRNQQVNDGCFKSIDEVPKYAVTLTIPTLMMAKHLVCTVPAATKAEAVFNTINGKISTSCPATIMKNHESARMFCDAESAKHIVFNLSVITDEISQDIDVAIKLAKKYHYKGVEIRSVWDKSVDLLSDDELKKLAEVIKENSLCVSSVSTSLFKCDVGCDESEKFERIINACKILGCNMIRGFSFWENESYSDEMLSEVYKTIEPRLKAEGITLAIENDPSVNLCIGSQLGRFFGKYSFDNIGILWDAGNNIYTTPFEIPYPNGYECVRGFIKHIHIKDAVRKDSRGEGVAVGCGEVDFKGQFKALLRDGYNGWATLETHYKKKATIDEELLKRPGGAAFSADGEDSTEECMQNLERIITEAAKCF